MDGHPSQTVKTLIDLDTLTTIVHRLSARNITVAICLSNWQHAGKLSVCFVQNIIVGVMLAT